jgi:hypothetical protein
MSAKRPLPTWLKSLMELGKPRVSHSDTNRRAYRTVYYRYFWGLSFLSLYFLLGAYILGGDGSGSTDNGGIFKLLFGALLAGVLGAFFAPRLNESLEKLLPSGRRNQEDLKRCHSSGRSSSSRRSRSEHRSSSQESSHSTQQKVDTSSERADS